MSEEPYGNLGNARGDPVHFKTAIGHHKRDLEIAKQAGNRVGEGRAYGNLGKAYYNLGDFKTAIDYHESDLQIAKELENRAREGMVYGNLGRAYHNLGDFKTAIAYHERHLKIAGEIMDKAGEGRAYGNLGNAYDSLGDYKTAIDCNERSLNSAKEVSDRAGEGRAYGNLGKVYGNLGESETAVSYHERHLKIAKELGDKAEEGRACGNLGNAYYSLGLFQTAIEFHERDLEIANMIGDRSGQGRAYCNLGSVSFNMGDFKKAMDYYERYLKIAKEVGDMAGEGIAYGNLGNAYHSLGDFKTAITYQERSLKRAEELGDRAGEGRAYNNLGSAYIILKDVRTGIHYYERYLKIVKKLGDKVGEGVVYGNLANAYKRLGDFHKAIEYDELCLKFARETKDRNAEGRANCNIGITYSKLGDFKAAIDYHERHLKFASEVGDRAGEGMAYGYLGSNYYLLRDFKTAISCHERHLKISKTLDDKAGEGLAYGRLGKIFCQLGDFKTAIQYHEHYLKIAKEVRDRAGECVAYGNLGAVHVRLRDFKTAIYYLEQDLNIPKEIGDRVGEARSLYWLGRSLEGEGSLQKAFDYYNSSVKVWNDVRDSLNFKDEFQISFRNMHQEVYTSLWRLMLLKQGKVAEALFAAEQGRAQTLNDLLKLNYASKTPFYRSPQTEAKTLQALSCLPSKNTVFVAADETKIVSWVIQKGKDVQARWIKLCEDDDGDENVATFVENLIQNSYTQIGARAFVKCEDRSLRKPDDENFTNEDSELKASLSLHFQENSLKALYKTIMGPIADLIQGNELTFVPYGPIWLVPFAAMVDADSRFLCQSFKIRLIPSLTSLKLIADSPPDYHSKTGVLLVGDPCLEDVLYRGTKLDPLPWARKEVEMIGEILGTAPLTGKKATKEEVLRRISSVALVHIAAHGRMETGEIALAPNATREPKIPVEDDFILTMQDVKRAEMRAQLVVLSSCHSGRGDILKAEGVVGIGRAFLGAGARSVLVSMWAIDDEATHQFMKIFYQYLVRGKSASESLNRAMNCMRDSEMFCQVRYWAPFVLIGDDVSLNLNEYGTP